MSVTVNVRSELRRYNLPEDFKVALERLLEDNVARVHSRTRVSKNPLSLKTQAYRIQKICHAFVELRENGYALKSPWALKQKHVEALVDIWVRKKLTGGTIENKLTYLRALAQWMHKPNLIGPLESYVDRREQGLVRSYIATEDKSWEGNGVDSIEKMTEYSAMEVRSEYKVERELNTFCRRLLSRLVMEASRKFAPAGGRIEIDQSRELDRCGLDIEEELRKHNVPDLNGFWQHLERTFGGEAGERVAFEQAAKAIIDGFWLKPDTEIKRTSSAVILEKRVTSQGSYQSKGQREVYYSSQQTVVSTFDGLATFAKKHQFTALAMQLRNFNIHRLTFSTRDKLSFPGLEIVMFNDKWQFKFAHDVGDALSLFISEFGAQYLASRDRY